MQQICTHLHKKQQVEIQILVNSVAVSRRMPATGGAKTQIIHQYNPLRDAAYSTHSNLEEVSAVSPPKH